MASPADLALLDEFCDRLWLEDGLAKSTLATGEPDVFGYLAFHH